MVRDFSPEDSRTEFSAFESPPYLSPLTCVGAVTVSTLVKFGSGEDQFIWTFPDDPTQLYSWGLSGGRIAMRSKGTISKAASYTVPRNKWLLVTYVKGAGTVKPKFYIWDYEKEELTVVEGSVALADCPEHGGNEWRLGATTTADPQRFTGKLAAQAIWETALTESQILTGLIEVEYLTEWITVQESLLRGLYYYNNKFSADQVIDWSSAKSANTGGINGETAEEEPPVPYQEPVPPVNVVLPTLATYEGGAAAVNLFLAATQGEWSGLPKSYIFKWERSDDEGATWTLIQGKLFNSPEYEMTPEDEGGLIRLVVIAENDFGEGGAEAEAVIGPIEPPPSTGVVPTNTVAPVASGTPEEGQVVSCTDGSWTNAGGFFYYWYASPDGITDWQCVFQSNSVTLQADHVGMYLRCRVIAYPEEEGSFRGAYSNVIGPVEPEEEGPTEEPPVNTAKPGVSGIQEVGHTLTGTTGSWEGEPESYEYQWEVSPNGTTGWELIPEATATTLSVTEPLDGKFVRFRVTAINGFGSTQAFSVAKHIGVEEAGSGVFMVISGSLVEVGRYMLIDGELVAV